MERLEKKYKKLIVREFKDFFEKLVAGVQKRLKTIFFNRLKRKT